MNRAISPLFVSHGAPTLVLEDCPTRDFLRQLGAPGDAVLAKRVLSLLQGHRIAADKDMSRGLDHGAWVPLMLMYPDAEIPVIQLSVQPHLGPEHHLAVGKALQPLIDERMLLLASGSATHNLRDFSGRELHAKPLPYAREFSEWLTKAIIDGHSKDVLDYLKSAPQALRNHPTPEHFLPLLVPMGAGRDGRLLHDAYTYGVLSMAAYAW